MTAKHPQLNQDALEAAARALLAVQQPEVSVDYAWSVQFDDGREELRKEAAAAVSAYFAASPGLQLPKIRPAAIADNTELFMVASTHHFHDHECLCGFKSPISRERTEHIMMHTLDALLPKEQ